MLYRASRACSGLSYFFADSMPYQYLNFIGIIVFSIPVYILTQLRPNLGNVYIHICNACSVRLYIIVVNYLYFLLLLLTSSYCNLGLIYLVCMLTPETTHSRVVYSGLLIPIQIFLSGFLLLTPTMPKWLVYIYCFILSLSFIIIFIFIVGLPICLM